MNTDTTDLSWTKTKTLTADCADESGSQREF